MVVSLEESGLRLSLWYKMVKVVTPYNVKHGCSAFKMVMVVTLVFY